MSIDKVLMPAEAAQRLGVRTLVVIEDMYEKRVPRVRLPDGTLGRLRSQWLYSSYEKRHNWGS